MTVQLMWDWDYVIVDGHTYRNHPKRLVLAQQCKLVSKPRAVSVLKRIVHEDRSMLERLCLAFDIHMPRSASLTSIVDKLASLLGPPPMSPLAPPGMFARMYVLERERTKPPKPAPVVLPQPERSLEEIRATVSLVGVDRWGNPLPDLPFELISADGAQRSSRLDGAGEAIESDGPEAGAELGLVDIGDDHWATRGAPPIGWLQKGVSIVLRDAAGEPLGGAKAKMVFANGAMQAQELDAAGVCRIDETPSYPVRIEFPDFDVESYD